MNKIYIAISLTLFFIISAHAIPKIFKVKTGSMEPTLKVGDYIMVTSATDIKELRGKIVAYYPPNENKKIYIHRCIAIEGDSISFKDGKVYHNDKKLDEPYTQGETRVLLSENKIIGVIPKDMVVILGDNRENAADSRYYGYVSFEKIIGIANKVLP